MRTKSDKNTNCKENCSIFKCLSNGIQQAIISHTIISKGGHFENILNYGLLGERKIVIIFNSDMLLESLDIFEPLSFIRNELTALTKQIQSVL